MKTAQFDHCPVGDSYGETRRISSPASLQNKLLWRLAISALVVCAYLPAHAQENEWVWVSGSSLANQGEVIGSDGTPAASVGPGARAGAAGWTDNGGNFWLFGAAGYDLWEFNPVAGQWQWTGGNYLADGCIAHSGSVVCVGYPGVYGSQGVAAPKNWPAERGGGVSWTDQSGNLWLFGGAGFGLAGNPEESQQGILNDLWEFNPNTLEWTWVSGDSWFSLAACLNEGYWFDPDIYYCWNLPKYGQLGVSAAENTPGSREYATGWTDQSGNLWLFGGQGIDLSGNPNQAYLNDLWEFDVSTAQWTWMGGSSTGNQPGVYGPQGMASAGNGPGGRQEIGRASCRERV